MNSNKRIKRKVRNAYAISTVSIALVLFLLGAVGYLILGALNASDRLKESVSVYVMLDQKAAPDTVAMIGKQLQALDSIKEVRFISKDQAAREFQEYLGTDFVDFLQENPLPDSYELKLDAAASDRQSLARLMFGGALLVISLVLLNNTIRVSIFSKRYVINTMKLVGATRWFIMRPFLGSSILQGIYSGLISWVMLAGLIAGLHEGLPDVRFVSEQMQLAIIFGAMMVGGILISLIFTTFAVRKFLKMKSSKIYLY